jgi:monomeric isocitrate dehydrogenase
VQENRTHVAHMTEGDFYASEKSHIMEAANTVSIIFTPSDREQSSECLKLKPVLG